MAPMESPLKQRIAILAEQFAEQVVKAVSEMVTDMLHGGAPRGGRSARSAPGPRRHARRSSEDLGQTVDRVVAELARHPDGIRAENLRETMGLERGPMVRAVTQAIADKRVRKTGEKRSTTYFLVAAAGGQAKAVARKKGGAKAPSSKRANGKSAKALAAAASPA